MRIPSFQLSKLSPKLQQLVILYSLVKNGVGAFALRPILQILPNMLVTCTISCLRKDGCHPFLDARVSVEYKDQTVWFANNNLELSERPTPQLIPLWIYNTPCNGIAFVVTVLTSCNQQSSFTCGLQKGTIQIDYSMHASKSPYRYVESHKKNWISYCHQPLYVWWSLDCLQLQHISYNGTSGKLSLKESLIRECAYCLAFQHL